MTLSRTAAAVLMATLIAPTLAAPAPPSPLPLARPERAAVDCLRGQGYLRARIRGALTRDLDWRRGLACEGEARPDGSGVRLSFVGPPGPHRLRLIFGVRGVREGVAGRELPVNLTVLEEGGRIFATRGEDKCTIDDLRQRRAQGAGQAHTWRITARGFCTDPINTLGSPRDPAQNQAAGRPGRIVINRFDFAGVVSFPGGP